MSIPKYAAYFLDIKEDEEFFKDGEVQDLPEVVVKSTTKKKDEEQNNTGLVVFIILIFIIKKLFK